MYLKEPLNRKMGEVELHKNQWIATQCKQPNPKILYKLIISFSIIRELKSIIDVMTCAMGS